MIDSLSIGFGSPENILEPGALRIKLLNILILVLVLGALVRGGGGGRGGRVGGLRELEIFLLENFVYHLRTLLLR